MPTRYLKPGIRDSDTIERVSERAEICYYRLLVTVDDFGRFDARPAMIKAECFPIRDAISPADCTRMLLELEAAQLLDLYTVSGKPYLQLRKWDNKPRSSESKFPPNPTSREHPRTLADKPRTSLPVTVTVTGTETETGSGTATDPPLPVDSVDNSRARSPETLSEGKPSEQQQTPAGLACRAMREAGLTQTNPGDPRLLALLEQGATIAELRGVAMDAAAAGKGWAWALAALQGRRADAAKIALAPDPGAASASKAVESTRKALEAQRMTPEQRAASERARAEVMSKRRSSSPMSDADSRPQ